MLTSLPRRGTTATDDADDGDDDDEGDNQQRNDVEDKQEDLPLELKDMANRDPKAFLAEYKSILRAALKDPKLDPPVGTNNESTQPITDHQPSTLSVSALMRSRQIQILDDVLGRDIDLVRPLSPLASLPKPLPLSPRIGKRKSDGLDEFDDGVVDYPPSLVQGKRRNVGPLPLRSTFCRSGKLEQILEFGETRDVLSGMLRS